MTERLVECVPNFSEGRDAAKIEKILDAVRAVPEVAILDVDPGAETNRTVVTLLGPPEAVVEAAFAAIRRASEVIDMRTHKGAHPRHGATDVCPFVPVAGVTMDDCVALAESLGERVGRELGIPVYLYDRAARVPARRSLAKVRAGEYEALPEKLAKAEWKPDFGPATFHARAGVVTIGAREFLIAWNVNLNSTRKEHADDIASELRETGRAVRTGQTTPFYSSGKVLKYEPSEGRFPSAYDDFVGRTYDELAAHYRDVLQRDLAAELAFFGRDPAALEGVNVMKHGEFAECRGVGWVIPEYGRAQLSFNLTNYHVTPPHAVLQRCRELAAERGLVVTGSEVVGMIPFDALRQAGEHYLATQDSSRGVPVRDVLETAVQSLGLRDVGSFTLEQNVLGLPRRDGKLVGMTVDAFTDEVSRGTPAPGGGSIAALAGALAAALASMVANLSFAKRGLEAHQSEMDDHARAGQSIKDALLLAVDADTAAFESVLTAMRLPKDTEAQRSAREQAVQDGYRVATDVPFRTAELSLEALRLCRRVAEHGMAASVTDVGMGAAMARAAVQGGVDNVRINLGSITDAAWVAERRTHLDALLRESETLYAEVRRIVDAAIGV
ncbi:MAG: glutamate formimidoyltransferase [Planctomycetes bacterium]|nr:glutamate formimidoyltransferase [Planctomycetota bacterium]